MEIWRRNVIVFFGLIEAVLFSGCIFGWTSLLHVLQQEGVYSHLCELRIDNNNNVTTKSYTSATLISNVNENETESGLISFRIETIQSNLSFPAGEQVPYFRLLDGNADNSNLLPVNSSSYLSNDWSLNLQNEHEDPENENDDDERSDQFMKFQRCSRQDNQFSLIYTIAAVNYGLTSILIGFSLDKFGLWVVRFSSCLMTTGGFLCLAFTSKEFPWLLWPALNLLSIGTIQMRQSSFQFANIYPKQRSTILTLYSAGYSISTTMFLLIQYGYAAGIRYSTTIFMFTGISLLSFPFTFVLPRIKIEDEIDKDVTKTMETMTNATVASASCDQLNTGNVHLKQEGNYLMDGNVTASEDELEEKSAMQPKSKLSSPSFQRKLSSETAIVISTKGKIESLPQNQLKDIPLKESVFTLSTILHVHWHFINFFLILFYSVSFNPWAYKTTDDPNQIAFYNEIAALCQLIAPIFIPIAGFATDLLIKQAEKYEDPVEKLAVTLEAPAYTLVTSTLFTIAMLTCKMFLTKEAIYASLVLIAICRPLVIGCCTSYIRIRFHPAHFNRLFGIFTTTVSVLSLSQYPLFVWMFSTPENFIRVHWLLMGLLISSFASPGHILFRCLSRKYALSLLKYSD